MTSVCTGASFSRCCVPVPVTTTSCRLSVRHTCPVWAYMPTANSQRPKAIICFFILKKSFFRTVSSCTVVFLFSGRLDLRSSSALASGRLDLRSSPALARHSWNELRSALASGRSSDFPQSALPSRVTSVALYKQTLAKGDYSCRYSSGLSPDSLASGSICYRIAISGCKSTHFLVHSS